MYQLYFTQSGAPWSSKQLIWQSDMAIEPEKYGIYDMKCSAEINKAAELQFLMTKSCSSYDLFSKERSVLTLVMDGTTTIFRGVVKTIETDLFFQRTITANSDLVYLSDSVFEPHGNDIEETPAKRFKRILDHHNVLMQGDPEKQIRPGNFTFEDGADDVEKYAKNGGYKDTMSQLQNDFKDFYGFYNIRYNDDYSKKWLDYTETTGKSTSQDIKFAVNIEDYQFDDTVDDLFTILIPCGGDNLTLKNQNAHRNVDIRMPDQTKRRIEVYIVDRYIKIVEGIQAYGYIYQAESFTVDSNNIGKSGTNGRVGGSASSQTGYEYELATYHEGQNPVAEGLYWFNGTEYVKATETSIVYDRAYYTRSRPTRYAVKGTTSVTNPKAKGWYEYSNGVFTKTNDTTVVAGKTYYSSKPNDSGSGVQAVYRQYAPDSSENPAELGLWYKSTTGEWVRATETTPIVGRRYFKKSGGSSGGGGGDEEYDYEEVIVGKDQNPAAMGLWEKKAFTISAYQPTSNTEPLYGKKYYRRHKKQ